MAKKGINISGTKEVLDNLKKFGESGDKAIKRTLNATSNFISTKASSNAQALTGYRYAGKPVNADENFYQISRSINNEKINDYSYKVYQNSVIGAYVEFGTGAYVDVPMGWNDVAWSYYVNGKGYMSAQPYFIPAVKDGEKYLQEQMKNALEDLTIKWFKKL